MKKQELERQLAELGVRAGFYSLNGELLPDRVVLYQNYNRWEVFYFDEKGNREDFHSFDNETDACDYIYRYFADRTSQL